MSTPKRLVLPADELEAAWAAVHDAMPPGWFVGRPSYHDDRHEWAQYAFNPTERASVGVRSRGWTAVADSEAGVLRVMARCLREISEGRLPRKRVGSSGRPRVDAMRLEER
jgi:hypothetical protein